MVSWILQSLVDRIYFSSPCCFASYFFRLYRVPANAAKMLTRSVLTESSDGSVSTDERFIDATLEKEAPAFVHQGLWGGSSPCRGYTRNLAAGAICYKSAGPDLCFSVVRGVVSVLVLNRGWCCVPWPWRCWLLCRKRGHYIPQPPGIIDGIYIAIAMIMVIAVSFSYITDLPMRLLPPPPPLVLSGSVFIAARSFSVCCHLRGLFCFINFIYKQQHAQHQTEIRSRAFVINNTRDNSVLCRYFVREAGRR
jgi:hypothetical protein